MHLAPRLARTAALVASSTAIGLALVAASLPASAAPPDEISSGTLVLDGPDATGAVTGGQVVDAVTGVNGWTYPAFDQVGPLWVLHSSDEYTFSDPDPEVVVSGGVTTVTSVYTGVPDLTVTLVVTLSGNTVRWVYTFTRATDIDFTAGFTIDQAADDHLRFGAFSGAGDEALNRGWVVSYGDDGGPVIGHSYELDFGDETDWMWIFEPGQEPDDLDYVAANPATMTYTAAVADYNPCGLQPALDAMATLAPTLRTDGFGTTLPRYEGECVLTVQPVTATVGVALDQDLVWSLSEELAAYYAAVIEDGEGGVWLDAQVSGLPAGITATVTIGDDGLPVVHLSGTPTASGAFTPVLHLALSDGEWGDSPVSAELDLTVAAAGGPGAGSGAGSGGGSGSGSGAGSTTLPVTGSDGGPLALLAGGLLLTGALVVAGRRFARG